MPDTAAPDLLAELLEGAPRARRRPLVVRGAPGASEGGEPRRHVLRVPFEARYLTSRHRLVKEDGVPGYALTAAELPADLVDFASDPYSWERWVEEDLNAGRAVTPPAVAPSHRDPVVLRPHQVEAVRAVGTAHASGARGFLIADDVGLGKTFEAAQAVLDGGFSNALVVAPLSALAQWRASIAALDTAGAVRWCVVNYDRTKTLLSVPKRASTAKRASTRNKRVASAGVSLVEWDVVVLDEAHMLTNPVAQRTSAVRRLTGEGTTRRSFAIWLSATAGQTPLALSYLSPVLVRGGKDVRDLDEFAAFCRSVGVEVRQGMYGRWEWEANDDDLETFRALLFDGAVPRGIRRRPTDVAGWPEQQRVATPLDVGPEGARLYREAWTAFRSERGLEPRGKDPTNALARQMRFRQKAELLRVPAMAAATRTELENGFQVCASFEFLESIAAFVSELGAEPVAVITGEVAAAPREAERLRFQRGEVRVVAYNVTSAISLHAGDTLAGGNDVPRTGISSPRWSGTSMLQIEGRSHRDGNYSLNRIVFAAGTIEEDIVNVVLGRMRNVKTLNGDDTNALSGVIDSLLDSLGSTTGVTR